MAYYLPRREDLKNFKRLTDAGGVVSVFTNSYDSHNEAASAFVMTAHTDRTLRRGATLFGLNSGPIDENQFSFLTGVSPSNQSKSNPRTSTHGKSGIIDDHTAFVGATNFDPRSFDFNAENVLFFHDPEMATLMAKDIARMIPYSERFDKNSRQMTEQLPLDPLLAFLTVIASDQF